MDNSKQKIEPATQSETENTVEVKIEKLKRIRTNLKAGLVPRGGGDVGHW